MVCIQKFEDGVESGKVECVKQVVRFPGDIGIFDFWDCLDELSPLVLPFCLVYGLRTKEGGKVILKAVEVGVEGFFIGIGADTDFFFSDDASDLVYTAVFGEG